MANFSKRIVVLVLVGVLAAGFVFASKNSINIQLSPLAYQKVRFDNQWNYYSGFGFGAKVGYKYNPSDNFSTGLSASIYDMKMSGDRYYVFSLTAEMGVLYNITPNVVLDFDLGLGADYRVYRGEKNVYPSVSIFLGSCFQATDTIAFISSAEFKICQESCNVPELCATDFNLVYYLGVKVNL